jgi:hypothetical protein
MSFVLMKKLMLFLARLFPGNKAGENPFDYELTVDDDSNLEYIMSLIKQAIV